MTSAMQKRTNKILNFLYTNKNHQVLFPWRPDSLLFKVPMILKTWQKTTTSNVSSTKINLFLPIFSSRMLCAVRNIFSSYFAVVSIRRKKLPVRKKTAQVSMTSLHSEIEKVLDKAFDYKAALKRINRTEDDVSRMRKLVANDNTLPKSIITDLHVS